MAACLCSVSLCLISPCAANQDVSPSEVDVLPDEADVLPSAADLLPSEAADAWSDYRDLVEGDGIVISESQSIDHNGKLQEHTFQYRWRSGEASLQTDAEDLVRDRANVAFVRNPDYAFQVAQSAAADDWTIAEFTQDGQGTQLTKLSFLLRPASNPALAGLLVDNTLLPEAIEEKWLRISSVNELEEEGVRLVELTLEQGSVAAPRMFGVQGGTLTLAPHFSWMITSAHLRLKSGESLGTLICQNEYGSGPLPVVINRVQRDTSWDLPDGTKSHTVVESEFSWGEEHPTDADFRLTAYGLPEPVSENGFGRRAWLILLNIAVVLIIAVLIRVASRRKP